jgi:hypothetical protein
LEEADESVSWLELIQEAGIKNDRQVTDAMKKGNKLVAIFVASSNTARNRVLCREAQKKNQSAI